MALLSVAQRGSSHPSQLTAIVRTRPNDAVTILTCYLVLLVAIPSRFVIGPLGGAGTPALVLGLGCGLWWVWSVASRRISPAPSLVRKSLCLLLFAVMASYVAASARVTGGLELSSATLSLIALAGWVGVLLLALDGVSSNDRLNVYLSRIVWAGTALALFGLIQFATGRAYVDQLSIPGLTVNNALTGVQNRDGFLRPTGTAIHPIEFGVFLGMVAPLALARAAADRGRPFVRRWVAPAIILFTISLSSSRSALVCAGAGLVVVMISLERPERRLALRGMLLLGLAVFVSVPGMLGSIAGLFTDIGNDSSARSRTDSYAVALRYLAQAPVFGRGLGTLLPRYRIFDNQFLLLLVEIGVVGLCAMLILLLAAIFTGISGKEADYSTRIAARGLVGGIVAGSAGLALFDALSFPMVAGMLFLLIGLVGATRRLKPPSGGV